jgi:hypothetical protein
MRRGEDRNAGDREVGKRIGLGEAGFHCELLSSLGF